MIRLASVIDIFSTGFLAQYRRKLTSGHRQALAALRRCRTAASAKMQVQCTGCAHQTRLIALLQVLLKFVPVRAADWIRPRAAMLCTCCGAVMKIVRMRIAASFAGGLPIPLAVQGAN